MSLLVVIVFIYPLVLVGVSLWRSRRVKSHEDFMVAGRSVPVALLVGVSKSWLVNQAIPKISLGHTQKRYRAGTVVRYIRNIPESY